MLRLNDGYEKLFRRIPSPHPILFIIKRNVVRSTFGYKCYNITHPSRASRWLDNIVTRVTTVPTILIISFSIHFKMRYSTRRRCTEMPMGKCSYKLFHYNP